MKTLAYISTPLFVFLLILINIIGTFLYFSIFLSEVFPVKSCWFFLVFSYITYKTLSDS